MTIFQRLLCTPPVTLLSFGTPDLLSCQHSQLYTWSSGDVGAVLPSVPTLEYHIVTHIQIKQIRIRGMSTRLMQDNEAGRGSRQFRGRTQVFPKDPFLSFLFEISNLAILFPLNIVPVPTSGAKVRRNKVFYTNWGCYGNANETEQKYQKPNWIQVKQKLIEYSQAQSCSRVSETN